MSLNNIDNGLNSNDLVYIFKKLKTVDHPILGWRSWSNEEIKTLMKVYLMICKKESSIFEMIYDHHSCDTWEDIFRDYDQQYLEDKKYGVEVALRIIHEKLNEKPEKKEDLD